MAGWTSKTWQNLEAGGTELNADGFIDIEDRLGGYIDDRAVHWSFRDFGGLPSNSAAANTTALNTAISTLAFIGGGCLYIPPGTYSFNGLTRTVDNLHITGAGPGASILRVVRTNQASPVVEAIRLIGDNLSVSNLTLREANQPATRAEHILYPGYTGVRLGGSPASPNNTYSDGVSVTNCEFQGIIGQAIVAYYTERAFISGNRVANVGEGIAVENCKRDAVVIGNTVRDSSDDCLIVKAADDNDGTETQRALVSGNIVKQGDAKGITILGTDYATVTGNVVEDMNQFGICVFSDPGFPNLLQPTRVTVSGNVVRRAGHWYGSDNTKYLYTTPNASACGLYALNTANVKFIGNQVYDSSGRGICIDGVAESPEVSIEHNDVIGATGSGIVAGDPDGSVTDRLVDCTIHGNRVRGTVGGILAGTCEDMVISDNRVRSYKSGASGSRRGIQVGISSRCCVSENTIINDDGGAEQLFFYGNAASHVDRNNRSL